MEVVWLQISAGRGPAECERAVELACTRIQQKAKEAAIAATIVSSQPTKKGFQSLLLELRGENVDQFAVDWQGTLQWICPSPFRKGWARKNWFVGVEQVSPPEEGLSFKDGDLVWQTMRASGAGGQHVNRTESAVRLTHLPSGISVIAQDGRSQHSNKKIARERLLVTLAVKNAVSAEKESKEKWKQHNQLERGNPSKIFQGENFKEQEPKL